MEYDGGLSGQGVRMTQKTKSRLRIAGAAVLLVAVAAAVYLGFTQGRVEATETAVPKDATGRP